MNFQMIPTAWAAGLCLGAAACAAQTTNANNTTERVVVIGNPLGQAELAQPTAVLMGERLLLKKSSTLGETLEGVAGVASSGFGPNSQRPVIRGLDGDRVRLLDNAGATIDASNLSYDHAVAMDPLVIERVEVLRGPASLLYGGNATGGVVNTIDNRIPKQALTDLGGRLELRGGGAASERSASAVVEGRLAPGWSWHVDAFDRKTSDLKTPRFTPVEDGEALEPTDRVRNSAAKARGGALGVSWADDKGFVGLSFDRYDNRYGVTVEPDVTIDMNRRRTTLAGERSLGGFVDKLSFQLSDTRYQHQEIEGSGEVGTTFSSRGQALRVEARHAPQGAWQGVWGMQAESMRFEALGEEAFVPGTRTRSLALFAMEEWRSGPLSFTLGGRAERVTVRSDGDAADVEEPRFGSAQSRSFSPGSLSVASAWRFMPQWSLTGSLGATQRAPAYYELYADGVHVATAAYERGDPSLGLERSTHADLGVSWQSGANLVKANVFAMRFGRFIALDATGETFSEEGEDGELFSVPVYAFQGVPANLWGLELEAKHRHQWAQWRIDGTATWDWTRGENSRTGEPLPRLAPMRLNLGLAAHHGAWSLGAGVKHAWAQRRVSQGDAATQAYTLVNVWTTYTLPWAGGEWQAFLKGDNLGNTLAYNATAVRTVRELSPQAGRAWTLGLQARF